MQGQPSGSALQLDASFAPARQALQNLLAQCPGFWSLAAFPQSSDEYYQKQAFALTTRLMSAIDFATTIPQLALTCLA
jgi:hypothetical protein